MNKKQKQWFSADVYSLLSPSSPPPLFYSINKIKNKSKKVKVKYIYIEKSSSTVYG
jgi:hypothetical protein